MEGEEGPDRALVIKPSGICGKTFSHSVHGPEFALLACAVSLILDFSNLA